MTKDQEKQRRRATDLIIQSVDAAKTYWLAQAGSIEESNARERIKSLVGDWFTFGEEQR